MKDKTLTKIILDIIMTVLFLILVDPKNTGMTFHEIAGLIMASLFIFHIFLNWSWIKKVSKNLFNPKMNTKPKLFYLLNTVSFISILTIIITGIEISKVLFVSDSVGINGGFVFVHKWAAYICLGLFGVHIVLHWRFIVNALSKLFTPLKSPVLGKVAMGMGVVVITVGLLYTQIAESKNGKDNIVNDNKVIGRREFHGHYRSDVYHHKLRGSYDNNITADSSADYKPSAEPSRDKLDSNEYPAQTGQDKVISEENNTIDGYSYQEGQNNKISSNNGTVNESQTEAGQGNSITNNPSDDGDAANLSKYLEKLFCNGCAKHCSLLNPECNKGYQQMEYARTQYQQQYESISL